MAKRGQGEGSIYKRDDGRWAASTPPDERGRRRYYYGRTREDVRRKLVAALRDRDQGLPVVGERQTLGEYLVSWLETTRTKVRPDTWVRYEELVRLHTVPTLGRVPLARLTAQHLQRLYAAKLAEGLSSTTVHHLHACLHGALHQAVRLDLLQRNVADLVDAPSMRHVEMQTWTRDQADAFLDTSEAENDWLQAMWVVALTTGMRLGEMLGLRWRYIFDLETPETATLQVVTTLKWQRDTWSLEHPKTAGSRRTVALSEMAVIALRSQRVRLRARRLELGPVWNEHDLVFPNTLGNPLRASNVRYSYFLPLVKKAGVPQIRIHDLRHTCATLLLAEGRHPKMVSEMLGHASVHITIGLYGHVQPSMHRDAARTMDELFGKRLKRS